MAERRDASGRLLYPWETDFPLAGPAPDEEPVIEQAVEPVVESEPESQVTDDVADDAEVEYDDDGDDDGAFQDDTTAPDIPLSRYQRRHLKED